MPAATSISNVCPASPPAPQRREAAELAGVVRPRLGPRQRGDDAVGRRHLDRRVGVPDLLARAARSRGVELAEPRELAAGAPGRRPRAPRRSRTRCPSRGARRRRRRPGTSRRAGAAAPSQQLLAVERPARRARCRRRSARAPNARWNGGQVGEAQAAAGPCGTSTSSGSQNASRRSSTSRSSAGAPVVGGVEEVGDPAAASRPAIDEPVIRAKRSCDEADARPTSAPAPKAAPTSSERVEAMPATLPRSDVRYASSARRVVLTPLDARPRPW